VVIALYMLKGCIVEILMNCVEPMTFYCGDQEQGVIGYPTGTKHCPYIA
jgi:hypothetical protein